MTSYKGQRFFNVRVTRDAKLMTPVTFDDCIFEASSVSVKVADTERLTVEGVELNNCQVSGGGLRGVYLRNVTVANLKVKSLPQVMGCVFEHVVLRGRINQLIIDSEFRAARSSQFFAQSEKGAYANIDWALDISELDCPDLDIRGVPARLVRRDPTVHAVVSYETAQATDWSSVVKSIDLAGAAFGSVISMLMRKKWEDVILVAARRGKKAALQREVLAALRERGLATD